MPSGPFSSSHKFKDEQGCSLKSQGLQVWGIHEQGIHKELWGLGNGSSGKNIYCTWFKSWVKSPNPCKVIDVVVYNSSAVKELRRAFLGLADHHCNSRFHEILTSRKSDGAEHPVSSLGLHAYKHTSANTTHMTTLALPFQKELESAGLRAVSFPLWT